MKGTIRGRCTTLARRWSAKCAFVNNLFLYLASEKMMTLNPTAPNRHTLCS